MTESQITEEILRYLQDKSYNYSVLIDGQWGSGKTYYVKNTLSPAIEKQEKSCDFQRTIKYISLYGCKNMVDVQENIAWSFAENAREKIKDKAHWGESGEKISGNILLSSKKIGNAILKKYLPETLLYEITSDWLNLGSFIFIFDDLERCDCPINEVFGFLNELVEHENTKVIIIANEKEISGIADDKYLELQYLLCLDDRIGWPQNEQNNFWGARIQNSKIIQLSELEKRRRLLFPQKEANRSYRRIREKLIGVSLKYEPDVPQIISGIIDASNYEDNLKDMLRKKKDSFALTMKYYHHNNIRTFQFFLSKVSYLSVKLGEVEIDEDYRTQICDHIISETFSQAVRFKSNFQPPRDDKTWLQLEQETKFQSIKLYVETGTFEAENFSKDVQNLLIELRAQIKSDDPYYLLYRQYYRHSQEWCEGQLESLLKQLERDRYPVSFYGKIVVAIQRLVDLGFNDRYMKEAKEHMLANVSKKGEVKEIDPDLWYVDDENFRERVLDNIADINEAIKSHSAIASRENVSHILERKDWLNRLYHYINPNGDGYVQDISVFAKSPSEKWMNVLHRATPEDIDYFRSWLGLLYPSNTKRKSYLEDKIVINEIHDNLQKPVEGDLIKKACMGWLSDQFETIINLNEYKE